MQQHGDNTSKVQKVVINVFLEQRWRKSAGEKDIELIVEVAHHVDGGAQLLFDQTVLEVKTPSKEEQKTVNNATKTGNKPVIIGDIVTDVAEFKPCFYTKITGEVMRGEEKIQDVVIYEQGKTGANQTTLTFPVVAGTQYAKAQIKLILDSDTEDCLLEKPHTSRVIDFSKIPEAIVVESRTAAKKTRIADSGTVFSGGDVKTRDSADENDGDNKGAHVGGQMTANLGIVEIGITDDAPLETTETVYTKEAKSDTEVEIELLYDFTNKGKRSVIAGMLANIWPIRQSKAMVYPIGLHTCRKAINLNVEVYPDIKWIMQLAFNYDSDKLEAMRTEEHRKYELKVTALEDAYKKETAPERQRVGALKEYKQRAEKRRRKIEKKIDKSENLKEIERLNKEFFKAQRDVEKWDKKIVKTEAKYDKDQKKLQNDKKAAKKAKNRKKRDNIELDDAYEDGLADFQFSLAAEFDRPYKGIDVTPNFDKIKTFMGSILKMEAYARKFGRGDEKTKGQPQEEDTDKLRKIEEALTGRNLFTFEIIPPSLAFALSWYAEHPKSGKGSSHPAMGVVWAGEFKAEPVVGVEFTFDIIALIAKAHPIIKGLVVIMDLIASLADEAEIRVDFHLEGKFNLEGKGRVNTYSGRTNFNSTDLAMDEDDSPFALSGEIEASLNAEIKLKQKYESWFFADVEVGLDVGAQVLSGVVAEGKVKADDKGMYLEPTVAFKGIKVILHLVAFVKVGSEKDTDSKGSKQGDIFSKEKNKSIEFVLMDSYEWGSDALGLSKWYIT